MHAWRKRPPSICARAMASVAIEIKAAHERTRQTYGPESLQADLAYHCVLAGISRMRHIRNELGRRCRKNR